MKDKNQKNNKKLKEGNVIKTAIRLKNDTVMVFDAEGEQIPRYQGHYKDVKGSILRDANSNTVFNHWFGHAIKPESISKENW